MQEKLQTGDKLKWCCGNREPPLSVTPIFAGFPKKKTHLSVQIDQIALQNDVGMPKKLVNLLQEVRFFPT